MQIFNFSPFPILTTKRLILRQLKANDDVAISVLRSNEQVTKFINRPKQTNLDEAKAFRLRINKGIRQGKCILWAICLKGNPALIGSICLWNLSTDGLVGELGYELFPSFHGQGIMQEAFDSVLEYGIKTMHLQKIEAFTHKDNERSKRLLVKNNFKADYLRKDEGNLNNVIYILTIYD